MLNVSLLQIKNVETVLAKLVEKSMKGTVAFKLARLIKSIEPELANLESTRVSLLKKFEELDQDFREKPEKVEEFQKEFFTVLSENVELNVSPLAETDIQYLELTLADMIVLEPFVS